MTKYSFITPVWGETYIDTFLNVSLPTQLSAKNLLCLANRPGVTYRIYTRPQDVARLEASAILDHLAKCIKTEVIKASKVNFNAFHHYESFSDCYRLGIATAERENAAAIFLTADQVWADGSLKKIVELGDAGYRAVMISGPRVNENSFVPELMRQLKGRNAITIPSPKAVKMAMDHLHPWDRSLFWDVESTGRPASFMYWLVPNEGFIMRCLHLHPVLVNPSNGFPHLHGTIDGSGFMRKACPDLNDLYVIQDSGEAMYFSVAPPDQSSEWIDRPKTDFHSVVSWALTMGISKHNLHYLQQRVFLHTKAITEKWDQATALSDEITERIVKALDYPRNLALMRLYVGFRSYIVSIMKKYPRIHKWCREMKSHIMTAMTAKDRAL